MLKCVQLNSFFSRVGVTLFFQQYFPSYVEVMQQSVSIELKGAANRYFFTDIRSEMIIRKLCVSSRVSLTQKKSFFSISESNN